MTAAEITMQCQPFRSEGRGIYRVRVADDGTVRVYDSVAGHFTLCHNLTAGSQAAARRKAAKASRNR